MNVETIVSGVVSALENLTGKKPCKKTLQKIFYLIEEAGDQIGFDYTIHFYGPYSADLDYEIQDMIGQGELSIEYTQYGHLISTIDNHEVGKSELSELQENVIERFGMKSASELELLATALFVQRNTEDANVSEIVFGVKRIKGTKYSDAQIGSAIKELCAADYF